MQDTAGEAEMSYGPPHKAGQKQDDQLEHTYSSNGRIRDVSPEDLPEAMNGWEKCRERVRDIRTSGTTWWWSIKMIFIVRVKYILGVINVSSSLFFLETENVLETNIF